MNKFLLTTTLAFCFAAAPAFAGDGHDHGPRGDRPDFFKEMDANADGAVSKEEAAAFHEKRFDAMDANKDGKITKEEGDSFKKAKFEEFRKKREDAKE